MSLHLLKLCVGVDSVEDLESRIDVRRLVSPAGGHEQIHTTRMVPKRIDELLAGGSLYWVIKGQISARQIIRAIRPFTDGEGIGRCHLVLDPEVVRTRYRPKRPFQGWRYLERADAPADISDGGELAEDLPLEMRRTLIDLGLL